MKHFLGEQPVSLSEVKELLTKRKKDGELTYEQKQTLEYVKEFAKIKPAKAREAMDKLVEMGIDARQAAKIVDIMPKDEDDIKLLFAKEHYTLPPTKVEEILELLRSFE